MARLIVKKKGYIRKAYTRKDGTRVKATRVKATSYKVKDRGKKGRAKKVLPKLKKGTLGISFKEPRKKRISKLSKLAEKIGERKVIGKLRAIQVLNKRTNKIVSRKAKNDAHYIAGSFKGKKKVGYPKGFGRSK